ncbi:response regulator [Leptothermofonsia sichuanensis E412]|nr:response regulator [Leptothermofonsia sichuanensis]QZZ22580.1 response regulator [Leptothermofonsia sichuanensis E412]
MIQTQDMGVVLVVDDNPTNLEVLSNALTSFGYETAVANDGEGAIAQIAYDPPDLILLDVMMPGIDGFETCQRLKMNPATQDIPVIFMTALSDTADKVKGLNLGAVDYITKPFQQEEVLARVKLHLRLKNLAHSLEQQNELLKVEVEERRMAEASLHRLTQELEQRVAERTADLSKALHELQQTQIQLVQSEKLSSLGQLVAGIAHEINNPVNFIAGNLIHIDEYTQNLLEFIRRFEENYPDPSPPLKHYLEEIDLEFLKQDLEKIVSSMKLGADRIRQIVLSLRNFSRLDEAEFKAVDIHEGIDSTLLILHNRLKSKPDHPEIQVVKEYGNLPAIECYAGQLNQVFMNLLSNAIDALEESATFKELNAESSQNAACPPAHPTITIRTEVAEPDFITITIADNGPGIPEEVRKRLFDPFFTTKPIGKGTGLGLSISHQVVTEKHRGSLWCVSEPGRGAEFWIKLPIHQVPVQATAA